MNAKLYSKLLVKCPWCLKSSNLEDWDSNTFSMCMNRKMKRDFKHLDDPKSWTKSANVTFRCPICKTWARSFCLKIENPSNELERNLGGVPIINIKEK